MQQELNDIQADEAQQRQQIEDNLRIDKINRLAEYEERLKSTGSQKEFNKVLGEYQKAQLDVDKELDKQRQKEQERLDRDIKARRAAARAKAKARKDKEFAEIEQQQKEKIADELREQIDIKNALVNEDSEA